MFAYIVRRSFAGFIMLIVMSLVTFLLFFACPIDPGALRVRQELLAGAAGADRARRSGYDKPVFVQWTDFLKGVVKGRDVPRRRGAAEGGARELVADCPAPCLGYSVVNTATVNDEIKDAFPVSLSLALVAFVMWMAGGVLFGVIAALKKGIDHRPRDRRHLADLLRLPHLLHRALPAQVPRDQVADRPDPRVHHASPTAASAPGCQGLLLPGLTLALFYMAGYVRMTRAFVLESMGEDYLRTAKAKGLAPRRVLVKHSMRAALTPLVTMAGLDLAGLMGGAIITETVFNYNGLGKLAVDADQHLRPAHDRRHRAAARPRS